MALMHTAMQPCACVNGTVSRSPYRPHTPINDAHPVWSLLCDLCKQLTPFSIARSSPVLR